MRSKSKQGINLILKNSGLRKNIDLATYMLDGRQKKEKLLTTTNAFISLKFRPFDPLCNSIYGDQERDNGFVICVTKGPSCTVAEIICSFADKYRFEGIADTEYGSLMCTGSITQETIFIIPPRFYNKDTSSELSVPKKFKVWLKQSDIMEFAHLFSGFQEIDFENNFLNHRNMILRKNMLIVHKTKNKNKFPRRFSTFSAKKCARALLDIQIMGSLMRKKRTLPNQSWNKIMLEIQDEFGMFVLRSHIKKTPIPKSSVNQWLNKGHRFFEDETEDRGMMSNFLSFSDNYRNKVHKFSAKSKQYTHDVVKMTFLMGQTIERMRIFNIAVPFCILTIDVFNMEMPDYHRIVKNRVTLLGCEMRHYYSKCCVNLTIK
jgi:hypothetical protein